MLAPPCSVGSVDVGGVDEVVDAGLDDDVALMQLRAMAMGCMSSPPADDGDDPGWLLLLLLLWMGEEGMAVWETTDIMGEEMGE